MKKTLFLLAVANVSWVVLSGCGKGDATVQARFKDFSKEEEKVSPQEREYLAAARPFVNAIAARDYTGAFGLLSKHAHARMSLNQFVPSLDDKQYERNETSAAVNVTPAQFAQWMAKVEAEHGQPASVKNFYLHSADTEVLSGRGDPIDRMLAIGAIPASIPTDIRKASLRGQMGTKLSASQLQEAAQGAGMSVAELEKTPDFQPYFNFKLVLVEEEGALRVGYFEFLPPSMLD